MKKAQDDYFDLIIFGSVLLISWTLFQLYYINYAVTGNSPSLKEAFGFQEEPQSSIFIVTSMMIFSFSTWLFSLIYSRMKLGVFRKGELMFWCIAIVSILLWANCMHHLSKAYLFESGEVSAVEYFGSEQDAQNYEKYQKNKKALSESMLNNQSQQDN